VHQPPTVRFELRRRDTGSLVHAYATEAAALAFVRDVVRIGGREQATGFALDAWDEHDQTRTLAEGLALVQRALEDRAE
jgi:predicted ArsR family transcriptional regulator